MRISKKKEAIIKRNIAAWIKVCAAVVRSEETLKGLEKKERNFTLAAKARKAVKKKVAAAKKAATTKKVAAWKKDFGFCPVLCWTSVSKEALFVKHEEDFSFGEFAFSTKKWFATCGKENNKDRQSIVHKLFPWESTAEFVWIKEFGQRVAVSLEEKEGWVRLGEDEEIAQIRQDLTSWRYDREEFKNAFARLARLDRESAKLAYENTASKWDGWGNVTTYGKASLLAYENTFNLFDFEWVADKIAEEAFDKNLEWPSGYETIKHEKIDTTLWIFPKNRIFVRKKEEFVLSDFEASGFDFFATCGAENNPSNYYWNDEDDYFFQEEDKSLWNYMVNTTKDIFWDWSSEEYEKYSKAIEPLEKEKLLYFKELENCYAFSIFPVEGWEHLGEDKTTKEGRDMDLKESGLQVSRKSRGITEHGKFGPKVRVNLDQKVWTVHEDMYSQNGVLLAKKTEQGRIVLPYYGFVNGQLTEVEGEEANIPGVVSLYSLSNREKIDQGMLPVGRYNTKDRDASYEAKLAEAWYDKFGYAPYLQAGEIFLSPAVAVQFYTEQDKKTKDLKPAAARAYAHGPSHWLSLVLIGRLLKGITFVVCDLNSPTLYDDLNKAVANSVIAENPFKTEALCKLWGNYQEELLSVVNIERLGIEMDGNSICAPNVAKRLNLTEDNSFQIRACLELSHERQNAIDSVKREWALRFKEKPENFEKAYNEILKVVGDAYRSGIVSNTETPKKTVENLAQFYCKGLLTPCRALKPGFVLLDVNNMFKTGQKVDMIEGCKKFGALNITSKVVFGVLQDYGTGSMKQGSQPVNYSVAFRSLLADEVVDGDVSEEDFDIVKHTTSHLYPSESAIKRFGESINEALDLYSTGTDPRSAVSIAKGKDVDKENVTNLNFWNHPTARALMVKEQQSFLNAQPYTTQTELWKKLGLTLPQTGYMADWINASVIPPMALVANPYFIGEGTYKEGEIKIGAMQRCTGPEFIPAVPMLWGTRGAWDLITDALGYEPDYLLGDALRYPTSGPQVYTNILIINPFKYYIGLDDSTNKMIFASDIFACNAFVVNPWVSKNIFTGDTDGDTVAWRAYFTPQISASVELKTIKLPDEKVRGGQLDILRTFYAPENYKPQVQIAEADLTDEVVMPIMFASMPDIGGEHHGTIYSKYPDTMVFTGIHDEATWTYDQSFVEDALGSAKSKAGDIKLDEYRLATLDAQPGMVALFQGYIKEYMDVYFTNTHLWDVVAKKEGLKYHLEMYKEMTKVFYASAMVFLEGTIMGMKKDTQPQLGAEMGRVAVKLLEILLKHTPEEEGVTEEERVEKVVKFLSLLLGAGWSSYREFSAQKWWTNEEYQRRLKDYNDSVSGYEATKAAFEKYRKDGKPFSVKVNSSTFETFAGLMKECWEDANVVIKSKIDDRELKFDPYRGPGHSKLRSKSFVMKLDESASEEEKWGILKNPFGEYHIEKGAQSLVGTTLANHSQIHSKTAIQVRKRVEEMTNFEGRKKHNANKCMTNPNASTPSKSWELMFRGVDVERGAVTSWSSKKENVLNELYILDILRKALKPSFTAYFAGGVKMETNPVSTKIWVNLKRYMDSIEFFDFEDEAARTKNLSKFFLLWIIMETVHNYKTETFEVDGKLKKIARNPNLDSFEDGLYYARSSSKSMTQTFGMILNEISKLNLESGVFARTDVYMNALSKKIDLHCEGIKGKPHWFWKVFKAFGLKDAFVAELRKEILLVKSNAYKGRAEDEEPICLFADFSLSAKTGKWYIYTKTGAEAKKPYGLLRPAAPFTRNVLTKLVKHGWEELESRIASSILPITRKLKYLKSTMPTPLKEECWIVGNDNTAKSIPFGRNITHDLFSASFLTRIGLEVQQSRTATKQGGVENTVAVLTTKAFAKKFKNSNTVDARKLLIPNMIEFGKTIFNAKEKKESVLSMKEYTFVPKYTKEGDTEVHYFDLIHKKTGLLHGYVIGFDRISAVNARNALGKSVVFTKGKDFDVLSFKGDEWAMFNAKTSILKKQWDNEVEGEAVAEFQKTYGANNRPDESKDAKYFTSERLATFTFNFEARDPAAAIHDTMHQLEEIYLKEGKEAVDAKVTNLEVGFNPYRYEVEKANVIGKDKNTYEFLICEYALENNTRETELGYHYPRAKSETGEDIKVAKYLVTFSMNEIALEHSPTLERFVGTFNNKIERQFIYSIKEMSSDEVEQYYGYDEFVSAEEYFEEKSTPVESEADINALLAEASYQNDVQHEYQNFNQDGQEWADHSNQAHPSYEDYSQYSQDFSTNNEESHNPSVQASPYYDDCNHCEYDLNNQAQEQSWEDFNEKG